MNLSPNTSVDNDGNPQQNLSAHVGPLVRAGYGHALHAVIPPGGKTSPTSKIAPDQLGKIPGRWDPAGWHGYNWRQEATQPGQLARDLQRGGNLGMQTFDVPFVDVDVRDPEVSAVVDGKGGWVWSMKGMTRVLYELPRVIAAVAAGDLVFVTEGEKDADRLNSLGGLTATTNPEGAGNWRDEFNETLRSADVVVLPDNDERGRAHAARVAASLHGIARRALCMTPWRC